METADVVVIGAGANGTSTAFHLAKAGVKRVVVVERQYLGSGATGKSGALVRMHYTNEPEVRLAFESLKYFQHWQDMVGGDCGFQPLGLLVFTPVLATWDIRSKIRGKDLSRAHRQRTIVGTDIPSGQYTYFLSFSLAPPSSRSFLSSKAFTFCFKLDQAISTDSYVW
jgi:glycine/D-amino acid oxidase-like deaminating enzyme